jgi:hypothetical protein
MNLSEGARAFRWFQHDGRRHAISNRLLVGDDGATLCGVPITVPPTPPPLIARCWPTCGECDVAWRTHEGIPVFPRPRTGTGQARLPRTSQ